MKVELVLGGMHGMRQEREQMLVSAAFGGSGCKLTWCDGMEGYLYTHAAFVLPCACLCYGKECDLRKADCRDIQLTVEAGKEGYRRIEKAGMKIRPAEDEKYDQSRSWQILMNVMLWGMAKTRIAELCIADHCRHAVQEMAWMDQFLISLKSRFPEEKTPAIDQLRNQMPSWDRLLQI